MILLPTATDRKWRANHLSDILGDIVNTRAVDLDDDGYLTLARKVIALYTETQDADFGLPVAIVPTTTGTYNVVTSNEQFNIDPAGDLDIDVDGDEGDSPNFDSGADALYFAGRFTASGATTIGTKATGWTERINGLDTDFPHPLCNVETRQELAVGDGNVVKFYDTSYVLQTTLTLPVEYVVMWIRFIGNDVFVGTKNTSGGHARVFKTDGASTEADEGYSVKSDWAFSGCEFDSSLAVLNSIGQVLRFNGGGFDVLGADRQIPCIFPVYNSPYVWNDNNNGNIGKCAQRGMISEGDNLYINIDGSIDSPQIEFLDRQPSGLWSYNYDNGLTHKAGYVFERHTRVTPTALASSILTFAAAHGLQTGDPVLCGQNGGIVGVNDNQTYYAIVESTTAFKLAISPEDAVDGKLLILSGSLALSEFAFDKNVSLGAVHDLTPGAVAAVTISFNPFHASDIIFGGEAQSSDGVTNISTLMSFGLAANVGSATTARIVAKGVTDNTQKAFLRFRGIHRPGDAIEVKVKKFDRFGLPIEAAQSSSGYGTWTSETAFTVSGALRALSAVEVGDEVEFILGAAAGKVAHIAAIDTSVVPHAITLDREMDGVVAGNKSDFVINNFKTIKTINVDTKDLKRGYAEIDIGGVSGWIQFKFEMRGYPGLRIEEFRFINDEAKQNG